MKISAEKIVTVKLQLTEEEAEWLKNVMQKPLHGQSPEQENQRDYDMREAFFLNIDLALSIGRSK
jgi:hypothetical protein